MSDQSNICPENSKDWVRGKKKKKSEQIKGLVVHPLLTCMNLPSPLQNSSWTCYGNKCFYQHWNIHREPRNPQKSLSTYGLHIYVRLRGLDKNTCHQFTSHITVSAHHSLCPSASKNRPELRSLRFKREKVVVAELRSSSPTPRKRSGRLADMNADMWSLIKNKVYKTDTKIPAKTVLFSSLMW